MCTACSGDDTQTAAWARVASEPEASREEMGMETVVATNNGMGRKSFRAPRVGWACGPTHADSSLFFSGLGHQDQLLCMHVQVTPAGGFGRPFSAGAAEDDEEHQMHSVQAGSSSFTLPPLARSGAKGVACLFTLCAFHIGMR